MEQVTFGVEGGGGNWSTERTFSISGVYTASTRSNHGFNIQDILSSIASSSVVFTAGTPSFMLPALAEFGQSVLLITSTRRIWAVSSAHTPSARSV